MLHNKVTTILQRLSPSSPIFYRAVGSALAPLRSVKKYAVAAPNNVHLVTLLSAQKKRNFIPVNLFKKSGGVCLVVHPCFGRFLVPNFQKPIAYTSFNNRFQRQRFLNVSLARLKLITWNYKCLGGLRKYQRYPELRKFHKVFWSWFKFPASLTHPGSYNVPVKVGTRFIYARGRINKLSSITYPFFFIKRRKVGYVAHPLEMWRRFKKRNVFTEIPATAQAIRRSVSSALPISTQAGIPTVAASGQNRLSFTSRRVLSDALIRGFSLFIFNKLHFTFSSTKKLDPTPKVFSTKSVLLPTLQRVRLYVNSLVGLSNLDAWQQRFRRAVSSRILRSGPAPKVKQQQRFKIYREYVRIRRQYLGLAKKRYGYKNNNPTRYATGQYYWSHHVLRKRILGMYKLPILRFKYLVSLVNKTSHSIGKVMSLLHKIDTSKRTLAYRYQMSARLDEVVPTSAVNLDSTGSFILTHVDQAAGLLPEPTIKYNYAKGYALQAINPSALVRKLERRQRLTSLQNKIGRCSWHRSITNLEWEKLSNNCMINPVSLTAGVVLTTPTRTHNIYNKPYTINHKLMTIVKVRTAS